jgi:hypothetical protein
MKMHDNTPSPPFMEERVRERRPKPPLPSPPLQLRWKGGSI